jgi:cellulose biosynthesis protein BcsQ
MGFLDAALGEKGQRVLVVDVDPQSNATSWLGARDMGEGMFACLCENGSLRRRIVSAPTSERLAMERK